MKSHEIPMEIFIELSSSQHFHGNSMGFSSISPMVNLVHPWLTERSFPLIWCGQVAGLSADISPDHTIWKVPTLMQCIYKSIHMYKCIIIHMYIYILYTSNRYLEYNDRNYLIGIGNIFDSNQNNNDNRDLNVYSINLRLYQQYCTRRWRKFQNRKPIGEVGCCESRMTERIH